VDQRTEVALYAAATFGLIGTFLLFMGLKWRYFVWCVFFGVAVFVVMFNVGVTWLFKGAS
jgi:hypothetical protein